MKSLFQLGIGLSFIFIIFLAISCKKDSYVDEENELVYPVNFSFNNFKSNSSLLMGKVLHPQFKASSQLSANYSEGFLYFWSFNDDTLIPDIKYSKYANPSITYDNGKAITFGAGLAFEGYVAGRAANFVGPKQILLKFPIKGVDSLSRLGFDMTGSATGPKDFEIYYSFDEGDSFKPLSLSNQFGNIAANTKSSFTYQLRNLEGISDELWIRITLKAGNREGGSAYNESSGTLRIDNLHLVGFAPTSTSSFALNDIHYFLFHKTKGTMIRGVNDDLHNLALELSLAVGTYDVFFVLNNSNSELLFPSNILKATDLYISNKFSNLDAEIYGYNGILEVTGNMSVNIILQRMYSQVKIEFTDDELSKVEKIIINQSHNPFFYSPFASTMTNPILDQTAIEINDDFQSNKQIIFNQFMGLLNQAKPVHYTVSIVGNTGLLRRVELNSSLTNNVQLVFRGKLLPEDTGNVGFQITKNENWKDKNEVSF